MTREFQVYQGAAPQSAQVQANQVPLFAGIPQNGAAVDAAIGEAQELGVKIARLRDLGLQQRVTQERERIRTEMDVEMQQAADVAWGSAESLFRADGSVNQDRYDAIVAKYWEECERIQPGEFALGENAVRYAGEQEAMHNDIALGMLKFTAMKSLENTRKAFSDNLELAVEREDWGAARGLVEDARGSLLNDTESEIELDKISRGEFEQVQRGYMEQAVAVVGSPEQFAALYDDPDFRARLSPENAAKLDAMAARLPVDVPTRKVKQVQQRDGSVKPVAEPAQAPRGLPRALVKVWNAHNGDFDGVDAREAAREPLMAYLRGLVQHADDPAELEQAKAVCKAYGHSAEFADSMVKQLRKEIDGTAAFNAKEAMGQFTGRGLFFSPYNYDKVRALKQEHAELAGRKRSKKEQARFSQLNEEIKKWEGWEKSSSEGASRAILARYDSWVLAHPEATYREQARVFYGFVDGYSKEDAAVPDAGALADADAGVYDAKVARKLAERRAAGEAMLADVAATEQERERMRELAETAQVAADAEARAEADEAATREVAAVQLETRRGVSRNWAGDAERSILYVPKGHAMAGQTVKLATPHDVCSYAEVVEHEGCTTPVMSQYLRRNLGVLHNPYGSITFDGYVGKLGATRQAGGATAKSLGGLAAYRDVFMDAAARNGLDPKLLMAIAMHETGRGTSSAFRNKKNAMGVSDAKGPRSFASVEDSIYFMARQLKKNYLDKGLRTVEQIGAKYAPIGAGNDPRGLNKHWVEGVSRYLNELN